MVVIRALLIEVGAGLVALIVGSLIRSTGRTPFTASLRLFWLPLAMSVTLATIMIIASARLLPRISRRLALFSTGGRARTGWVTALASLLSAGIVGALFAGLDGVFLGLLAATASGFCVFALVLGVVLGGPNQRNRPDGVARPLS